MEQLIDLYLSKLNRKFKNPHAKFRRNMHLLILEFGEERLIREINGLRLYVPSDLVSLKKYLKRKDFDDAERIYKRERNKFYRKSAKSYNEPSF